MAKPGDRLTVNVVLHSDTPTRAVQFGLTFDPSVVQVDNVIDGSYYRNWANGNDATAMTVVPFKPDNTRGTVSIGAMVILGGPVDGGPVGLGTLVTLQLTARSGAQGASELKFTSVVVTDAFAKVIPAVELTGAKIGVGVDAATLGTPDNTQTSLGQSAQPAATTQQARTQQTQVPQAQVRQAQAQQAAVPTQQAQVQVPQAQVSQARTRQAQTLPTQVPRPTATGAVVPTPRPLSAAQQIQKPRGSAGIVIPWELLAGVGGGLLSFGIVLYALRRRDAA